ncbi:MAG: hypothetical protein Q4B50_05895, partial [Bacillota bacterium]|nr:hypothetical protein [Bacillota bacterium]
SKDVETLRRRINENCQLKEDDFQQVFRIDCALDPACVNLKLAKCLHKLEPSGKGNETPLFAAKNLRLTKLCLLGKNGKTLRWHFLSPGGIPCEAIDFHSRESLETYIKEAYGAASWENLLCGAPQRNMDIRLDILYSVSCSCYMGRESAKIEIVSFRPSEGCSS